MTAQGEFPQNWRLAQDFDPNDHLMKLERFDKRTQKKIVNDYLNVQNRIIWFIRDQRELILRGLATTAYAITTEMVEQDRVEGWAQFKTYVRDVLGNEATMYGSETQRDFPDYAEKASTKSLGRALAMLGYGTQFAPEMDEGERVVDAPTAPPQSASVAPAAPAAPAPVAPAPQRAPAVAERETINTLSLKAQAWMKENDITGEAMMVFCKRHHLTFKSEAHLRVLLANLNSMVTASELYIINLLLAEKLDPQIASVFLSQYGVTHLHLWQQLTQDREPTLAVLRDLATQPVGH